MVNEDRKVLAIIQARMGSGRLPGKVLKKINNIPILKVMMDRIVKSEYVDQFVIATTNNSIDKEIIKFCIDNDYEYFCGSEDDVLSRYYECSKEYDHDVIVRLTSDCPLMDPQIIDNVILKFFNDNVDYTSNTVPPKTSYFPDGSDVEVFSKSALSRAHRLAHLAQDKEHVTLIFWKYNYGFNCSQLENNLDWSKYRITLDYPEDFEVITFIIGEIKNLHIFGTLPEIISILDKNPEIKKKNKQYCFPA